VKTIEVMDCPRIAKDKGVPETGEENLFEDLRVQQCAQVSRGVAAVMDSDFVPQSGVPQEYYRFHKIAIVQSIIPRRINGT